MLRAMRGAGAEIKYKAPRSLSSLPQNIPQRPNYGGDRQIRLRSELDGSNSALRIWRRRCRQLTHLRRGRSAEGIFQGLNVCMILEVELSCEHL